jgi:hypothetical protein
MQQKELISMDYTEERNICEFLGLKVDKGNYVQAYYGFGFSDGGKIPTGWQVVCHISKLKLYLCGKIHTEHQKKVCK